MTPDEAVVVRQLLGLVVERVHGPGVDDIVKRAEALLSPDPCVVAGVEVRTLTAKQLGFGASDYDSYWSGPIVGDAPAARSPRLNGLTVEDVLDIVAPYLTGEASTCECPDSFRDNSVPVPYCLRHTVGPKVEADVEQALRAAAPADDFAAPDGHPPVADIVARLRVLAARWAPGPGTPNAARTRARAECAEDLVLALAGRCHPECSQQHTFEPGLCEAYGDERAAPADESIARCVVARYSGHGCRGWVVGGQCTEQDDHHPTPGMKPCCGPGSYGANQFVYTSEPGESRG